MIFSAYNAKVSDNWSHIRLSLTNFVIMSREKIIITGENGSGKSTLADLIAGKISASGDIYPASGLTVGYLPQRFPGEDYTETVIEYYTRKVKPQAQELSQIGLVSKKEYNKQLGELSYGQLRRLQLATIVANPPELLILDEPTNHLALDLIEQIQTAADICPGSIVIITHDRYWIDRWDHRIITMDKGKIIADTQ